MTYGCLIVDAGLTGPVLDNIPTKTVTKCCCLRMAVTTSVATMAAYRL